MAVYLTVASYVASVLTVLAALFLPGWRLRRVAAIVGALSIWMPLMILRTSLGLPYPFAPPGNYQILGSQIDPTGQRYYVLLDRFEGGAAPRLYGLSYAGGEDAVDAGFEMQRNPYAYIGSGIQMGPGGAMNVTGIHGEPPEWDKDQYYENPARFLVRPSR